MIRLGTLAFVFLLGGIAFGQPKKARKEIVEVKYNSPDNKDTTSLRMEYAYYPKAKKAFMDSIDRRIARFVTELTFGESSTAINIPDKAFVLEALNSYKSQNLEFVEEEYYNLWFIDASATITDHKDYVTLDLIEYNYSGGAHPNSSVEFVHYDKKNGKRLSITDFVGDVEELTKIAEVYFRRAREISPDADLTEEGFWFEDGKFALNDNFYFVEDDLVFYFNNYEITAYAYGPTEFSIPLTEIKQLFIREP